MIVKPRNRRLEIRQVELSCRAFSSSSQRSLRTTAIAMVRSDVSGKTWNEPTFTVWQKDFRSRQIPWR